METQCIFCHDGIQVGNKNYISHLFQHHRIKFDMEHVLERTRDFFLLEIQRANRDANNMDTLINKIVNDILENVMRNSEKVNKSMPYINESSEYFDSTQIGDFCLVESQIDDFNTPINESFVSETDLSDVSFSSLDQDEITGKASPTEYSENFQTNSSFILNSISRINDVKSALEKLGEDVETETSINAGIMNNNIVAKKNNDYFKDGTTSLNSLKTNLGEINVDFHIKIEEIKKESVEIMEGKINAKRSYVEAFVEESNLTGRRKSARIEMKTQKSRDNSENRDFLEQSQIKTHVETVKKNKAKNKKSEASIKELDEINIENIETKNDQGHIKSSILEMKNEKSNVITENLNFLELPQIKTEILQNDLDILHSDQSVQSFDHFLLSTTASNSNQLPWFHGTIYSCQLCTRQFLQKIHITGHMESIHNVKFEEYAEKSTQSNKHECEICGKGFSWYKRNLDKHFTSKHNISLDEYYQKFNADIKLPNLHITDEKLLLKFNFLDKLEIANSSSNDQTCSNPDNDWSNRCKFQCILCQKEVNSKSKFGTHLKSQHQLTLTEYTKEHGGSMSHEEKHSCQVENCSSYIWWERQAIKSHLYGVHEKMSIEEYETSYMNDYVWKEITDNTSKTENDYDWSSKCIFQCALCQKEVGSRSKFGSHLKSYHQLTLTEYTKEHGGSMSHEEKHSCQVEKCNSYIWWDRDTIKSHLYGVHEKMSIEEYGSTYMNNYVEKSADSSSREELDSEWANQCTFQCALCFKEFNSKSKFGTHLKSHHQLSIKEYTQVHGKSILHEESHYCQIESCETVIIWDRSSISRHLRNVHDLVSLEDYKEKYMDDYVEKSSTNNAEEESINSTEIENDWSNKCTYTCVLCHLEFNSHSKFGTHLKHQHDMKVTEYYKNHGTSITHEEKHRCQVENCNATMWWDRQKIKAHLYGAHEKMSIDEYEKKYMSNYNEKSTTEMYSEWYNKCVFKCSLCQAEFNSRSKFGTHLKSQHELTLTEYSREHGSSMTREEKHSCQVENCNAYIWWDSSSLRTHLYNVHENMSLDKYDKTYMYNYVEKSVTDTSSSLANKCNFECALCKKEFNSKSKFGHHLKSQHQLTLTEYTKEHGISMSISEHLYKEKYMEKKTEPTNKSSKNVSTSSWANKCTFKCASCQKEFGSRRNRSKHLISHHQLSVSEYIRTYGNTVVHEEMHSCQVESCNAFMLWDTVYISNHVKKVHNMVLDEYKRKYMSNYVEKEIKLSMNVNTTSWANKCIFKCASCEKEFHSRSQLSFHLKSRHQLSVIEYTRIHGNSIVHEEKHSCQVQSCKAFMYWDRVYISRHLKNVHDLSLDEYKEKYMDGYIEKDKLSSVDTMKSKITKKQKVETQNALGGKTDEEIDEEVLKWTTGSLYLCKICDKGMAGLYQFKKHLKNRHNTDYKQYEKTYQPKDFILFSGFHICAKCQKNVRHDKIYLQNHMKEHNLTVREYMDKYKPKPPKLDKMMKDRRAGSVKKE